MLLFLLCLMAKKKISLSDSEKLGARIKALRKAKGYTNYLTFAVDHDLNPSQYATYESGKGNITWNNLMKIIRALDVEVSEFFSEGFE
jgi:transcriptional regulator with XRE-family HTH domain